MSKKMEVNQNKSDKLKILSFKMQKADFTIISVL